jgi:DNA-binding NarL/FixJ family response regulator
MLINLAAVLVVDDFEPFRRFICTALKKARFRIIEQASDGLEAVRKAAELQPDLILLDIRLPQLNGIEAAKRISKVAPLSKILFVSLDTSPDVVSGALNVGGLGYVHKSSIHTDLLPAVESVLAGRQFVSASLKMPQASAKTEIEAPVRHEVLFYAEDAILIDRVARFIAPALRDDNPAIMFITESHRKSLAGRLKEHGIDVEGAIRKGKYIPLDPTQSLSGLVVNGSLDRVRFIDTMTDLIESASTATNKRCPRIAIFGEGVSHLCAEGNTNAAIEVEKLCNDLVKTYENVDILCGYQLSELYGDERKDAYDSICKEHSAVHV